MYGNVTPAQAVKNNNKKKTKKKATVLLGKGFGTGEYELYGAFTANLETGELVDDPTAVKPDPS